MYLSIKSFCICLINFVNGCEFVLVDMCELWLTLGLPNHWESPSNGPRNFISREFLTLALFLCFEITLPTPSLGVPDPNCIRQYIFWVPQMIWAISWLCNLSIFFLLFTWQSLLCDIIGLPETPWFWITGIPLRADGKSNKNRNILSLNVNSLFWARWTAIPDFFANKY